MKLDILKDNMSFYRKYKIINLLLFFFIIIVFSPNCKKCGFNFSLKKAVPFKYEFIYSQAHSSVWGIWDTGYCGFSTCARLLRERGVYVSSITSPLDILLGAIPESEFKEKILFLNVSKFREYSFDEIEAVERFVEMGGKLFAIGEHDNMFKTSDMINPMLKPFDISVNIDHIDDLVEAGPEKNMMYKLNCIGYSKFFGLEKVRHLISASISCTGDCTVLLEGLWGKMEYPIAVGKRYGKGKMIVLADSEMWWNGDGLVGINQGDNRAFFIESIQWLLDEKIDQISLPEMEFKIPSGVNKKGVVFIDQGSYGHGADDSLSGIRKFALGLNKKGYHVSSGPSCQSYDVRVIAGPLEKIKLNNTGKKERIILFSESFFEFKADTLWGKSFLTWGGKNLESVYSDIEKEYPVKILPCLLTKGGKDADYFTSEILFNNTKVLLARAGAVEADFGSFHKWISPVRGTWAEFYHPGLDTRSKGEPVYEQGDIKDPVFAAYNKDILVISDSDIIGNRNADQDYFDKLIDAVSDWIEGEL